MKKEIKEEIEVVEQVSKPVKMRKFNFTKYGVIIEAENEIEAKKIFEKQLKA